MEPPLLRVKGNRLGMAAAPSDAFVDDATEGGAALAFCRAETWTRNPNTLGTYAEAAGRRSGTKLEKVIKNK
jgi:hypothetical protein